MQIFRVIVSFMREHMSFMQERGAYAMTPGQAADEVISALLIDATKLQSLKVMVEKPNSLDTFSQDCLYMQAIGSDLLVLDLWKRNHGDA